MINHNKNIRDKILWANRVSSSVVLTADKINATFSVKAKGLLIQAFVRMLVPVGLATTVSRINTIRIFVSRCKSIHSRQGMKGLVLWLKSHTVLLQQSLGGFRLHDITELKARVARTQSGYPKTILSQDRARIRAGDLRVMRFYLTLFNLYRVLEFPGVLKLGSITDPFKGSMEIGGTYFRILSYIPAFIKAIKKGFMPGVLPLEDRGIKPRPIIKSSPGSVNTQVSTTPFVLLVNAVNLRRLGLDKAVTYFIKYFEAGTKIPYPGLMRIWEGASQLPLDLSPSLSGGVGRLGFKDEAAGKVRVFAMCDAWTQWVLEPFHDFLFDILRNIPQDGTFDQLKPVREKAAIAQSAYSLDLTAATDRLPIALQIMLFSSLISREFAVQWAWLLVGRSYSAVTKKYGGLARDLYYSVGQPMGALSSWASLAMTHHFLVQAAAWDAGVVPVGTWFADYAILGDDLVIFDPRVKTAYLRIVAAIGVECGIAKSLLSPKGLCIEFAKRTLYKGQDISPVPLTEFLAALLSLSDAVQFARKYSLTFPGLLKTLGYGYRVLGGLNRSIGLLNSRVRALLFAFHLPDSEEEVKEMLLRGNPFLTEKVMKEAVLAFREILMSRYQAMVSSRLSSLDATPVILKRESEACVETMISRLYITNFLSGTLFEGVPPDTSLADALAMRDPNASSDFSFPRIEPFTPSPDGAAYQLFDLLNHEPQWSPVKVPTVWFEHSDHVKWLQRNYKPATTLTVPPALYNRVEGFIRDWRLIAQRVVSITVVSELASFRRKASDLLWEIKALRFGRSLGPIYCKSLAVMRSVSAIGTGKVLFYREPERLPSGRMDPVQMQYWRDFTAAILKVTKKVTESTK